MSDDESYYLEQLYKNMKRRVIHDYSNEQRITDILEERSKNDNEELEFDYEPSHIPSFVTGIAGFLAFGLFVGMLYVLRQYLQ